MKALGIDYGEKNIGIAISNSSKTMAFPYKVIRNDSQSIEKIIEIATKNEVDLIVVGKPTNLSGKENVSTQKAKKFYDLIRERFNRVELFDERMTTSLAHTIGGQMGVKNKKRKKDVDMIAASIILNDYLSSRKKEND